MLQGSEVPEGWERIPLANVGCWSTGGTPSRQNKEYYNGKIPWLKISDLNDGIVTKTEECITQAGLENSSAKLLPPGTICVAIYGSIGKLGMLGIPAATNQACGNCIVNEHLVERKYLFWFIMSQRSDLLDKGRGGTQANISNKILREWPLPLPPLAEQHRIVAAIEALFARLDAANARLDCVPGILKQFRQAVLAAACAGRLTEDWRIDSEARVDYQVERDISDSILRDLFDNFELPSSWIWTDVGKTTSLIQYGTSIKADSDNKCGIPVLRMGNIQDGKLDISDLKYISKDEDLSGFFVQKGDILFNRTNSPELVGKCAIIKDEFSAVFASYLMRIKCNPDYLSGDFLCIWINGPYGRLWARHVRTDGVSQSNINSAKLKDLLVPLPPLPEQREIVRRVDALFALADRIEAEVAATRAKTGTMRQSILALAFSGRLVPTEAELARREGREYEPASILLERIRSEMKEKTGRRGTQSPLV